jgi:hypothetical protein
MAQGFDFIFTERELVLIRDGLSVLGRSFPEISEECHTLDFKIGGKVSEWLKELSSSSKE